MTLILKLDLGIFKMYLHTKIQKLWPEQTDGQTYRHTDRQTDRDTQTDMTENITYPYAGGNEIFLPVQH